MHGVLEEDMGPAGLSLNELSGSDQPCGQRRPPAKCARDPDARRTRRSGGCAYAAAGPGGLAY